MNISIAIAQVLGLVLTCMGLSVVFDRKNVSAALSKLDQDRGFLWLWSFLILTMGVVLVVMNNIWTSGLPLFITVLAWLTLIKGFSLLFLPGPSLALYRKCNTKNTLLFGGVAACIIGLILLYFGFM